MGYRHPACGRLPSQPAGQVRRWRHRLGGCAQWCQMWPSDDDDPPFPVTMGFLSANEMAHEMQEPLGNEGKGDDIVLRVLAVVRKQRLKKERRQKEREATRLRYPNFAIIKEKATRALKPIKPIVDKSVAPKDMLFVAQKTTASKDLPEPHLVYFLFVEILDYKDLGPFQKLAYSIPIDFNGTAYLIEHRKFGLGVFASNPNTQEDDVMKIVELICNAVKIALPYFMYLENEAGNGSNINLKNHFARSL